MYRSAGESRVCVGPLRVKVRALSCRRAGKPNHEPARRELLAAAPPSLSAHINSARYRRTPLEPLSVILWVIWRLERCADRASWQPAPNKPERKTIEQHGCAKRQQLHQLQLSGVELAQVSESPTEMSCSARPCCHPATTNRSPWQRRDPLRIALLPCCCGAGRVVANALSLTGT